jgi:hypothetical protein
VYNRIPESSTPETECSASLPLLVLHRRARIECLLCITAYQNLAHQRQNAVQASHSSSSTDEHASFNRMCNIIECVLCITECSTPGTECSASSQAARSSTDEHKAS